MQGNEEKLLAGPDGYAAHYRLITAAIWKAYPQITIVASGRWGGDSADGHNSRGTCCAKGSECIAASPCLNGQRCDAWDDHYYLTPDVMEVSRTIIAGIWGRIHPRVPAIIVRTGRLFALRQLQS